MELMHPFTVSLFGHRQLDDPFTVERELEKAVRQLLGEKSYVDFLVGRDGEFDLLAASVIRRCRKIYREGNSSLVLVLPYLTAEYRDDRPALENYYDEVELCPGSNTYFRAAHTRRNRSLVDRSDLAVFWVDHPSGGAYQTLRYARSRGTKVLLLGGSLSPKIASSC